MLLDLSPPRSIKPATFKSQACFYSCWKKKKMHEISVPVSLKTSDWYHSEVEVQSPVCGYSGTTVLLGILMHAWCSPLNQSIPQGWPVQQSEVNGTVNLRDCVCYRRSGLMNYRPAWVKWAVYIYLCVCVGRGGDTEEAWQTCPLSADGGMHNSFWRQFHAVSLPVSSLFPKTDNVGFGYRGELGATSRLPSLAQLPLHTDCKAIPSWGGPRVHPRSYTVFYLYVTFESHQSPGQYFLPVLCRQYPVAPLS